MARKKHGKEIKEVSIFYPEQREIQKDSHPCTFDLSTKRRLAIFFIVLLAFGYSMPYVLRGLLSFTSTIMAAAGYTTGSVSVTYVTVPSMEIAKTLSSKIVSSKLAACVNIIPGVLSVYEWKGKVENDNELLLMIKTRTSLINELSNFVKANHPYEVPEVISLPVENGHLPYLDWVRATTKDN